MAESNRMKEMPVNKLMVQMGIPMILSMALQAVYNIVDSAFVGNMKEGRDFHNTGFDRQILLSLQPPLLGNTLPLHLQSR